MKLLQVFALILLCGGMMGMAKKKPVVTVRFHTEANPRDTDTFTAPVQLQNPPRRSQISKIPDISENDVAAIFPFPAADGTAGCAFKLNNHGTMALDTLSIDRRGTSLVALINGRQVIDLQIDKRVSDGVITIPAGLAAAEIVLLEKKFPILGAGTEKKKKKR